MHFLEVFVAFQFQVRHSSSHCLPSDLRKRGSLWVVRRLRELSFTGSEKIIIQLWYFYPLISIIYILASKSAKPFHDLPVKSTRYGYSCANLIVISTFILCKLMS